MINHFAWIPWIFFGGRGEFVVLPFLFDEIYHTRLIFNMFFNHYWVLVSTIVHFIYFLNFKVVVEPFCGEVVGGTKITLRPRKNANDRALIKSKYMHEKYIIIAQVSFIFSWQDLSPNNWGAGCSAPLYPVRVKSEKHLKTCKVWKKICNGVDHHRLPNGLHQPVRMPGHHYTHSA